MQAPTNCPSVKVVLIPLMRGHFSLHYFRPDFSVNAKTFRCGRRFLNRGFSRSDRPPVIESDPKFLCCRNKFVSRRNTRVEAKVSFLFQTYFSSQFIGCFRFMERDYRMNKVNDLMLFESVILHCQMTHNITGTREALVAAQKDGLVDFYNQLTSAGRNVGQMMLSNLEDYQTLFDVKFKKPPDFFDQQAIH